MVLPIGSNRAPIGVTACQLLEATGDWWVGEELNLRPHAYQACALTT